LIGAGYGGTKVQLSLADLRELIVAIPPPSEQVQIESYLDKSVAKFQQTMDKANQQIELLKERKSALISAAVTGKIDVRSWQL
jgi:type I restriction enzyme S subunit